MDAVGLGESTLHKRPLDRRKSMSTTGDGDQGDTCRICRGEGTADQPLFYPCKCSGSIKFVHQDCLMEWLSHSQKKYCELCKTSFRFTKLYNPSMPATLPLPLFLRQISVYAIKTFGRWLRYVCVTFIWTCCLPWSIRQIWRGLFWLADGSWMSAHDMRHSAFTDHVITNISTAASVGSTDSTLFTSIVSTQPSPTFDPVGEFLNLLTGAPLLRGLLRLLTPRPISLSMSISATNATNSVSSRLTQFERQPSMLSNVTSLNSFTKYPFVNNCLIDVLEGQLICLSVIAVFILVFLIREWVINQQPILNMPNPDQAPVQPAAPIPNELHRQPGRGRPPRLQRIPTRDEQHEAHNVVLPARPGHANHNRRAVTDDNLGTFTPSNRVTQEPHLPPRSSSLNPGPSGMSRSRSMGLDSEPSWRLQESRRVDQHESPPLRRGMFDDLLDPRRHIEENLMGSVNSDNHLPPPYEDYERNSSTSHLFDSVSAPSQQPVADVFHASASEIAHVRQVAEDVDEVAHSIDTPPASDSDEISTSGTSSEIPTSEDEESVSSESGSAPPNLAAVADGLPRPNVAPTLSNGETIEAVEVHGTAPEMPNDNETIGGSDTAGEADTTNVADRVMRWMWHTDEHMQIPDQATNPIEHGNAHRAHERAPILPANDANRAMPGPGAANMQDREANAQFGADLNEANAIDDAEDLEGILELIGMEGPLAGMIQNFIFSIFLITLTLSASVWCPYIWGKITILVMSNPVGVFVKAPLYFVSTVGNILIDLSLFLGGLVAFGLSNVTKLFRLLVAPAFPAFARGIKVALVENWAYDLSQSSGLRLEKAVSETVFGMRPDLPTFSMQSHHALKIYKQAFKEASTAVICDLTDTSATFASMWRQYGIFGGPLALLEEILSFPGATISAARIVTRWARGLAADLQMRPLSEMTEQDFSLIDWTTDDKILAILVGYGFFAIAGYVYLKVTHAFFGLKRDEKVDGVFADSLRQAGGVLKVIIIIGIEMIVFPLYCGLLLDCALLPLFRDATFQTRLKFLLNAPVTCLFIHWFIGTCYMFHFALFVSMCRKIMRKGVLYFIRDPDDPTFHPVRDVLERPVATQLGKIAFSALVYGGLVIVCLGGVVWTISSINGILPIHWSTNEPRLAFPIDILFYNFMLPFILRRVEPSKKISTMYEWWFRQCAKQLRLSHFLFGEEIEEEKLPSRPFWRLVNKQSTGISEILKQESRDLNDLSPFSTPRDGRYVRAPAADSVRIPKGTKVFVEVNEDNERIDNVPDRDTGMHGKRDERFVKIFVPSHFRARISVFVFLVWAFAASTGVAFTVLPLLVGRFLIHLATPSRFPPNDLYALTVGMHVCGMIGLCGYLLLSRRNTLQSKAIFMFSNTKDSIPRLIDAVKYAAGLFYLFTTVFVILPFTTSLLTELYIHMPIYSYVTNHLSLQPPSPKSSTVPASSSTNINPTIFILQTWTLGLLYLRLAYKVAMACSQGRNNPSTAFRAITRNDYLHPDVALASRALVLPAFTVCIVLLAAPIGLARIVMIATGTVSPQQRLQFYRYSYPALLSVALSIYAAIGLQHKIENWRVKVRDEVYLVGETLHNFNDPMKMGKDKKVTPIVGVGDEKEKAPVHFQDNGNNNGMDSSDTDDDSPQIVGHQFGEGEGEVAVTSSSTRT